jgi:hypothetical protein
MLDKGNNQRGIELRAQSWKATFRFHKRLFVLFVAIFLIAAGARGQSTGFTFQGQLKDNGAPANGNYDLELRLLDSAGAGTGSQVGTTINLAAVPVTNGVFTAQLDFGANAFPGADRFLEIGVKPAGSNSAFTILSPRQPVTPTPYALHSLSALTANSADNATNASSATNATHATNADNATNASNATNANHATNSDNATNASHATNSDNAITATNATELGGAPASNYVQTNDARLTDSRSPTAGSANYIQNTTTPQTGAGFNIDGSGTTGGTLSGNVVNTATEYDIGANRVLSLSGSTDYPRTNTFLGDQAGVATTPSDTPAFTGISNSFFGSLSGSNNTTGYDNTFFGRLSGYNNNAGSGNTFIGQASGYNNTSGDFNVIIGEYSGISHQTGGYNTFVGYNAGMNDVSGQTNTFIGASSGSGNVPVVRATAIGEHATVTQDDSLVLGTIAGVNGSGFNTNVGIGTTAPQARFHVNGTSWFQGGTTPLPPAAGIGIVIGSSPDFGYIFAYDYGANTAKTLALNSPGGRVGIGTSAPDQTLSVNGNASKAGGGAWLTFSDERLKNIKGRFTPGLKEVMQLEPIRYEYKTDNALDIRSEGEHVGFGAQAVEKVIPEAVTTDDKGYRLVNNDPIMWAMLNGIKEQQKEIEQLKAEVRRLRAKTRASHK